MDPTGFSLNVTVQLPGDIIALIDQLKTWNTILGVAVLALIADKLFFSRSAK